MHRIPLLKPYVPPEAAEAVARVLASDWIGDGQETEVFEAELADYLGQPLVVAVNSGTAALHLALVLAGVKPGDEVITAPMTCVATNMAVLHAGGAPVWADIGPKTGNIDPESIAKSITSRTKAIVVVDWGGLPCDLDEIGEVASKFGLPVIEDAAHALGAEYKGRKVGAHADFVCFSFQAGKMITAIDGGALVVNDPEHYDRARRLRWFGYGWERRADPYDVREVGYRYVMNDVQAAIGRIALRRLGEILAIRRQNALVYDQLLRNIEEIEVLSPGTDKKPAHWVYTVLADDRDALITLLGDHGIEAGTLFSRNDRYSVFRSERPRELPGVDEFARRMLCLPVGPWMGMQDVRHVADIVDYHARALR
jgi:perosamine synthetase